MMLVLAGVGCGREWLSDLGCRVLRVLGWAGVAGGQEVVVRGGPQVCVNSWVHRACQGQFFGRCSLSRRAEDATRAGTAISVRRMVAVVALASTPPARLAAARVRLKAITAQTSQALLAANLPEGRCASAAFFRS